MAAGRYANSAVETTSFALKMTDFALKTANFSFKTTHSVLNMMKFGLKMTNSA